MQLVYGYIKNAGLLDFVAAWYIKAVRYIDLCRSEFIRSYILGVKKAVFHVKHCFLIFNV